MQQVLLPKRRLTNMGRAAHANSTAKADLGQTRSMFFKVSQEPINPERATSMYLCHGVLSNQFIFRTVLARTYNIIVLSPTN